MQEVVTIREFSDHQFVGQDIRLDDGQFIRCTFTGCQLIYGGGPVWLEDCTYNGCRLHLDSAVALNTKRFFAQLGLLGRGMIRKPHLIRVNGLHELPPDEDDYE